MSIVKYGRDVPNQTNPISSSKQFLEEEILFLRTKMEQVVVQEKSLTSDLVVQISSKLDRKINEYMQFKLNQKLD